ncbi:MAG: hypothetical protein WBF58_24315, partial [Xanthobacteraceae bacterium]
MSGKKASKRGRALSILIATGAGYLIGSWNAAALHRTEPSPPPTAAQTVALRFPRALSDAPVVQAAVYRPPFVAGSMAMADAQSALFAPEPLIAPPQQQAQAAPPPPAGEQVASLAPMVP